MMKKVLCMILSCVMLVAVSPAVAADDMPEQPAIEENLNADSNAVIVHEQDKNRCIDELFELRCKLAIDFEKNQTEKVMVPLTRTKNVTMLVMGHTVNFQQQLSTIQKLASMAPCLST